MEKHKASAATHWAWSRNHAKMCIGETVGLFSHLQDLQILTKEEEKLLGHAKSVLEIVRKEWPGNNEKSKQAYLKRIEKEPIE